MVKNLLGFSRLGEHIFFVIPLTLWGAFVATKSPLFIYNLGFWLVLAANILAVSYAFMINDIEDAPDDKKAGRTKNLVANKKISLKYAWIISTTTFFFSAFLYFVLGNNVFLAGLATLILSFLYSWRPIRLKGIPALDMISHSLMLGGLLLLTSFFAMSDNIAMGIPAFMAATLLSTYGQFNNQLRDWKEDRFAKITNTSSILGKTNSQILLAISLLGGLALTIYGLTSL